VVAAGAKLLPEAKTAETVAETLAQRATPPAPAPPIVAYHGSPYSFDRFDMSKIGTGEGAQAYGHGLYFAGNEDVARGYRNQLAPGTHQMIGDEEYDSSNPVHLAANYANMVKSGMPLEEAVEILQSRGDSIASQAAELLKRGDLPSRSLAPNGSMYQVGINADPDYFLDWDKPLSEQHPVVQNVAKGVFKDLNFTVPDRVDQLPNGRWAPLAGDQVIGRSDGWPDKSTAEYVMNATAQEAQNNAQKTAGDLVSRTYGGQTMEDKSQALRDAGIPGIKYLDQGSRAAGYGTSNYVLFDDSLASILKKYGLAGLGTAGGAAALTAGGQSSMSPVSPAEAAPAPLPDQQSPPLPDQQSPPLPDQQSPPQPVGLSPQYDDWWKTLQAQRFSGQSQPLT
jgi:hypothetical protein